MGLADLTQRTSGVLAVDLSRPVVDPAGGSPLAKLAAARRPHLRRLVGAVAAAADDPRVAALLTRVDRPAASWAHAEELRAAVLRFRRSGKPAIAHAQTFGEGAGGDPAYYLATAFDEVWLQPTGEVALLGPAAEVPFVADLLDKLDVVAEVDRRHEYKSAADRITERAFTDAHREAVDRIVASHHEQLLAAIAAGRGVDEARAAELVDEGPYQAGAALEAGLVDRLAYRDEATRHAKGLAGDGARLVPVQGYRPRRRPWRRRATVALVHGEGAIKTGPSKRGPAGPVMGSDTLSAGFTQALADRAVKAVLFRVDSPGGSAVASDAIWRGVVRAQEAGKPVVVSMGPLAGSGGYWVATHADRVLAQPSTLTGSIGVVLAKFVTTGLRERLGITSDEAHRGANALMFSSSHRFTDEQRERVGATLDTVYATFVDRVADGRDLEREHVEAIARGRVWTGADAAGLGLVDGLGGYVEALDAVRALAGLPPDQPVRLKELPRRPLAERLGLRADGFDDARALLRELAEAVRGAAPAGAASMPSWARRGR